MSLESAYWAIAFKDWDYAIALIQRAMAIRKQRLPALHVLTVLHITRTAFLLRLATPTILPATLTPCRVLRQGHHGVATEFSVSGNSFVRFSSMPIAPDYFALILANTTNPVGFS
jgi:hypothetical protein